MTATAAQRASLAKGRAALKAKREAPDPVREADITARNFPNAQPVSSHRGRLPRAEVQGAERRRRKAGTLNRMAQFKLDIFDADQLDDRYVHRWITDDGSRIRQATQQDDYDFCTGDDIKGFAPGVVDSESDGRIRMITGRHGDGSPEYAYLCRKRREFFEADLAAAMDFRQDVMEGRVFNADLGEEGDLSEQDGAYVPKSVPVSLGNTARRRGPISRTLTQEPFVMVAANVNTPYGLLPIKRLDGAKWNDSLRKYYVPAGNTNALYIGDPVIKITASADVNGVNGVDLAAAGSAAQITGVVCGFAGTCTAGSGNTPSFWGLASTPGPAYRPASTALDYYVLVNDDPETEFSIQSSDTGGVPTATNLVGLNANLIAGTGSAYTGWSGWQLNPTGAGTGATIQLRVIGVDGVTGNAVGGTHAKFIVQINTHTELPHQAGI